MPLTPTLAFGLCTTKLFTTVRKMFIIVLIALVGICSCVEKHNYHAKQNNVNFTTLPGNEYIKIGNIEDGYPTGIEYLMDIDLSTGLMVRVVFGKDDGPLDAQNAKNTRVNICDILDKAIDYPESAQARYNMAESLGLTATRCPIEKGIKVLSPYHFPTEFTTKDLGCGNRYYEMRVETPNQDLNSVAIMTLHIDLVLTKDNETCTENSSSVLLLPSMITSIAIGLFVFKVNN